MAFPNWLQSLPSRLSFLGRPSVIASCSATVILGIFIWEYVYHPEWFGRYAPDETSPPSGAKVPALSSEERAAVADIDDLAVLLNQLGADENGIPTIQALPEPQGRESDSLLQELLALSEPADGQPTTPGQTPFAKYLDQYRFESPTALSSRQEMSPSSFADILADFDSNSTMDNAGLSPLAYALQNQAPVEREKLSAEPVDADAARSQTVPESSESTEVAELSEQTEEFPSRGVTIPGVPFPVLPTTPQMSPPPGSTGYAPPASLQLIPPVPGNTATGVLPAPGTPPLDVAPGLISPSPASRATPDLSAPQIDTGNSYTSPYTPYTPTAPAAVQGGVQPGPSVFSVPRPPGSYLGGGYINTFSNPSGPPN